MIFGKIDYINLLPLHIYLKKSTLPNGIKACIEYKKGVPSALNLALKRGRIDAAIISSIESVRPRYKNLDIGICANKRVFSVIVKKDSQNAMDSSSASSNALAKALKISGQVIIGDKALKLYLEDKNAYIDLCNEWFKRTNLPFVFARFSCSKQLGLYNKLLKNFTKARIKIPNYILQNYAKSRQIDPKDIKFYLEKLIYYKLGIKEKRALKKFVSLAKNP